MRHWAQVVVFVLSLLFSVDLMAERDAGGKDPKRLSFLGGVLLVEGMFAFNAGAATVSPSAVGVFNLLGLAVSRPNGVSPQARVVHYGGYLALCGYDLYADRYVPKRRMFWPQFIGINLIAVTPLLIDHFLGARPEEQESHAWRVQLAWAGDGFRMSAARRFGARE